MSKDTYSSTPVVNINIPENLLLPFHQANPTNLPAPVPLPVSTANNLMLLAPNFVPGPKLTIAQFCQEFGLQDTIAKKLLTMATWQHQHSSL
jgi:hypothetical protein